MPFTSHNGDPGGSGITGPKNHVLSPFDLDLTNGIVLMMTLLVSWDTDTSSIGIT